MPVHPLEDILNFRRISRLFSLIAVGALVFFTGCGDSSKPDLVTCRSGPETFTFFGLGRDSIFSAEMKKQLDEKLGSSAIAKSSIITLSPAEGMLLDDRFPRLSQLNRELNHPWGERVEHDVVKLMYRHVDQKTMPFDSVEVVFSGYSNCMLLMKIDTRIGGDDIVATLTEKYGPSKEADITGGAGGKTNTWEKNTDKLIVYIRPDRNNTQTFEIWFYFVDHIEDLIKAERTRKEQSSSKVRQSGEKAF